MSEELARVPRKESELGLRSDRRSGSAHQSNAEPSLARNKRVCFRIEGDELVSALMENDDLLSAMPVPHEDSEGQN